MIIADNLIIIYVYKMKRNEIKINIKNNNYI